MAGVLNKHLQATAPNLTDVKSEKFKGKVWIMEDMCFYVIMYQLAICYERYGLNPSIRKDIASIHFPNFNDIYESFVKKDSKRSNSSNVKSQLRSLIESCKGSDTFFNPHRNQTAITNSKDKWRLLFLYYTSNLKNSIGPAILHGGRLALFHQKDSNFCFADANCKQDIIKADTEVTTNSSDFLPAQLHEKFDNNDKVENPNRLSLVEMAGSAFINAPNAQRFQQDEITDMKQIDAIAKQLNWTVALQPHQDDKLSSDDDSIVVVKTTPAKLKSGTFNPLEIDQLESKE